MRALTAAQAARELGRSTHWLHENWRKLEADGKIPPPVLEGGALVWNAAQFYAYLDRDLPAAIRKQAAAFRAAYAAALDAPALDLSSDIAAAHAHLDARFSGASDAHPHPRNNR